MYGEFFGGVLCLLFYFENLIGYDGVIFMVFMCKIFEKMVLLWFVEYVLRFIVRWVFMLFVVFIIDFVDKFVKDLVKRIFVKNNFYR